MANFKDLIWEQGDNMGGVQRIAYFADLDNDIDTDNWPGLPAEGQAATMEDLITIKQDIPMQQGGYWKQIYITLETGAVRDEQIGEYDGKSFENYLDIFHPGNRKDALAFARKINNGSFVFLAKDAEGYTRIIGSPQFPAKADSNSITTGQAVADRKGMTLTVKAFSNGPAPVYDGNIVLEAAGSGSGSV